MPTLIKRRWEASLEAFGGRRAILEWCGLFCAAVRAAAEQAMRLGNAISGIQARWRDAAQNPRPDSTASRVIDMLPGHPILDAGTVESVAGVSNQAARLALIDLERTGVIRRINTGRRNRAWEAVGLFELVDSFERSLRTASRAPR